MVSADDGGWFDILVPNGNLYTYNKHRIYTSSKATIGTIAIGDLNGDGKPELVVPLYSEGKVQIYTYD